MSHYVEPHGMILHNLREFQSFCSSTASFLCFFFTFFQAFLCFILFIYSGILPSVNSFLASPSHWHISQFISLWFLDGGFLPLPGGIYWMPSSALPVPHLFEYLWMQEVKSPCNLPVRNRNLAQGICLPSLPIASNRMLFKEWHLVNNTSQYGTG